MGKQVVAGLFIVVIIQCICFSQDTLPDKNFYEKKLKFEQMIGYTFGDKGSWTNISPEVFLGFDTLIYNSRGSKHTARFRFGPTICAANAALDTGNYLKSLMLPGLARLSLSFYTAHSVFNTNLKLLLLSGSEIKMVGYTINNESVLQNNIKAGAGLEFKKLFTLSAEHTWAWHNLTNETEQAFLNTFHSRSTLAKYVTINVEGYSQVMDLYLIFSWRKFLNRNCFYDTNNMNNRILSICLRKDMLLFNQN